MTEHWIRETMPPSYPCSQKSKETGKVDDKFPSEFHRQVFLLGHFCLNFAVTELLLHHTLQELTGVNTGIFQAIFSGCRADSSIQHIKRLLQVSDRNEESKLAYAEVFTHIGFLNDARNLLLHYGVTIDLTKGEAISTNRRIALTPLHERTLPFSTAILESLVADTEKANAILAVEHMPKQSKLAAEAYKERLRPPWRYTPPQVAEQKSRQRADLDRKPRKAPKGRR